MKLDMFRYPTWRQPIRPAPAQREWMDRSPHQYAYRCLPLAMANSLGWELLCERGANAVWDGGDAPGNVTVSVDGGGKDPVALFGMGTLTFHIGGLFRTDPGWDLLVTGPLNRGKDGIVPLTGIVETSWSPYSFTMNWRFTRRNHRVRFDEGEPICMVMPIQTGLMEQFAPRSRPITDDVGLQRQFEAWSQSRDAFHKEMATHAPRKPSETWQKKYYRGLDMNGREQPKHRTKLRLRPFSGGS